MWKFLNSRTVAFYILAVFLVILFVSALLPSNYTVPPKEWETLAQTRPNLFWIYSHCSTPFLVKNSLFQLLSFLLFLSTLSCTVDRLLKWNRSRTSEFVKDKAFAFSAEENSPAGIDAARGAVDKLLSHDRWDKSVESAGERVVLSGQKGMSGFWGSVVFHLGLLLCFLAGPVTALTGFRGELAVTENVAVPLNGSVVSFDGKDTATLPEAQVEIRKLRGEYFEGQFKYDFGGTLAVEDRSGRRELPFAVNKPADYQGYQFSLHEYGFAPQLVLERDGQQIFDYYLNLRHGDEGDYFDLPDGTRAFVMFFPDFFMQEGKIGSRSKEPRNPVAMVKVFRGDREVFKGLFKPGEEALWEGTRIRVPDYRRWVTLIVTREQGIVLVILGAMLCVGGLLARFLSNERRIEFELSPCEAGTSVTVRGYSRYYPAFLEKEVLQMKQSLKEDLSQEKSACFDKLSTNGMQDRLKTNGIG